ncbi:MAG TPA: PCRF domain-containing protein, partial [bacterium]
MAESKTCGGIFEIAGKIQSVRELETLTSQPDFWNDNEKAQSVFRQINELKSWTDAWEKVHSKKGELAELLELAREENDDNTFREITKDAEAVESLTEDLELRRMFGGEDDARNVILTIHPGAGGTESQDWAEMLLRMYVRYAQHRGYDADILDLLNGEEAGIKSVSLEVKGEFAFGHLKAEAGVHRLVRISPFDANKRRHTSFASVFVYPEIEDNIEIQINPADLQIDT